MAIAASIMDLMRFLKMAEMSANFTYVIIIITVFLVHIHPEQCS
jgi:hypothetical protein